MNQGSDFPEALLRFWTRMKETASEERWRLRGQLLVSTVALITKHVATTNETTTLDVSTAMEIDISTMKQKEIYISRRDSGIIIQIITLKEAPVIGGVSNEM
jgi:hypothetical protein